VGPYEWQRLASFCALADKITFDVRGIVQRMASADAFCFSAYSGPIGFESIAAAARLYNLGDGLVASKGPSVPLTFDYVNDAVHSGRMKQLLTGSTPTATNGDAAGAGGGVNEPLESFEGSRSNVLASFLIAAEKEQQKSQKNGGGGAGGVTPSASSTASKKAPKQRIGAALSNNTIPRDTYPQRRSRVVGELALIASSLPVPQAAVRRKNDDDGEGEDHPTPEATESSVKIRGLDAVVAHILLAAGKTSTDDEVDDEEAARELSEALAAVSVSPAASGAKASSLNDHFAWPQRLPHSFRFFPTPLSTMIPPAIQTQTAAHMHNQALIRRAEAEMRTVKRQIRAIKALFSNKKKPQMMSAAAMEVDAALSSHTETETEGDDKSTSSGDEAQREELAAFGLPLPSSSASSSGAAAAAPTTSPYLLRPNEDEAADKLLEELIGKEGAEAMRLVEREVLAADDDDDSDYEDADAVAGGAGAGASASSARAMSRKLRKLSKQQERLQRKDKREK
jgi:hypothetical protein